MLAWIVGSTPTCLIEFGSDVINGERMMNTKTKVTEYTYETKVTCYKEQVNPVTSLFWQRCVCPCSGRTMITGMILRKTSDTTLVGSVETYPEDELNASDCYMWHVFMKPAMEEAHSAQQSEV